MKHFEHAYTSLFGYQVQPVDPRLACCLVHATAAINRKGNESTIVALEGIVARLRENLFAVLRYAFDGDSCFKGLRGGFQDAREGQLSSGVLDSFFGTQRLIPVPVSDPLHPLKRIRYRLLSSHFRIDVNEDVTAFSILSIQMTPQAPPVIFDNARITKMHDSLPLQLFSRQLIVAAFEGRHGQEFFALFPWYLTVAGLTHFRLSTEARYSMYELAFWLLCFYQKLLRNARLLPEAKEKIRGGRYATLYTRQQKQDVLNVL